MWRYFPKLLKTPNKKDMKESAQKAGSREKGNQGIFFEMASWLALVKRWSKRHDMLSCVSRTNKTLISQNFLTSSKFIDDCTRQWHSCFLYFIVFGFTWGWGLLGE